MRLTDISVRALKPADVQKTYFDDQLKGFGIRVSPGGTKTYVLVYGKDRTRVSLGRAGIVKLTDARQKAKDILANHQLNGEGEEAELFDTALAQFMKGYAEKNKPSTVSETERLLNRHLVPIGKGKTLPELTKSQVVKQLDAITARSERMLHIQESKRECKLHSVCKYE